MSLAFDTGKVPGFLGQKLSSQAVCGVALRAELRFGTGRVWETGSDSARAVAAPGQVPRDSSSAHPKGHVVSLKTCRSPATRDTPICAPSKSMTAMIRIITDVLNECIDFTP